MTITHSVCSITQHVVVIIIPPTHQVLFSDTIFGLFGITKFWCTVKDHMTHVDIVGIYITPPHLCTSTENQVDHLTRLSLLRGCYASKPRDTPDTGTSCHNTGNA